MAKFDVTDDVYASYTELIDAETQEEADQKMRDMIGHYESGIYDRIRNDMDFFELVVRTEN